MARGRRRQTEDDGVIITIDVTRRGRRVGGGGGDDGHGRHNNWSESGGTTTTRRRVGGRGLRGRFVRLFCSGIAPRVPGGRDSRRRRFTSNIYPTIFFAKNLSIIRARLLIYATLAPLLCVYPSSLLV